MIDQNNSNNFYASTVPFYDRMTRFDQRLEKEQAILKDWVNRYNIKTALDAACGTGIHAIALVRLGVKVIGSDPSNEMLDLARENAEKFDVKIESTCCTAEDLQLLHESFDAIFFLGNSLPHLLNADELIRSLKNFYDLLKQGGSLVIQQINYDKVLKEKERIVGVHRDGQEEFIRFYDFLEENILFNILHISWQNNRSEHQIHSTELRPYQLNYLKSALLKSGFDKIEVYGNMQFEKFDLSRSANIVIHCRK